jgi:outer membrane protein
MMKYRYVPVIAALLLCTMSPAAMAETPPPAPVQAATQPAGDSQKKAETTAPVPAMRVGYADIMKIAEKSAPGKAAKARFDAKSGKLRAQIEAKQKQLEKQKSTLETKLTTYAPEQRAARIKEYEKKVEEFRKLLQKADKELKPMQEELQKEIYDKIEKAATEYGAANGFSLILVKNDLLYLGKNVDIQDVTDALIVHLEK